MRDIGKKIISIFAAAALLGGVCATAACGDKNYKGNKLNDYVASENAATSNGGFAVEKDGFVYFINGVESYTASNKFGEVVKGSLMRIKSSDLTSGNFANVQTVVPMLLVAQNFESGVYIYGDYVYYATPTTDKAVEDGTVQNDWIDFKRAKLDGSETMSGYYFRLSNNSANYRFVQGEDKTVYCLYVESGALKSFNTTTKKTTVLVKNAASDFFFDKTDLTNGTVYYTMNVTPKFESESRPQESYTQLYKVDAWDTATVNASEASYTVSSGKTYDFDLKWMEENETGFKASDYTTYPYVNLGELVLDGIGSNSKATQYNDTNNGVGKELSGYNYTIQRNENGGVYFTRAAAVSTGAEGAPLYYVSEETYGAATWKTVDGNDALTTVAEESANLTAALIAEDQSYIYVNSTTSTLCKVTATGEEIEMAHNVSSATLWKTEGDYLYYYGTGTNGNNLTRINYKGEKKDYNPLIDNEEYKPVTFAYVDWNSAWYKPEMFNGTLLYSGAQSFGSNAYNYIYATDISMTNVELNAKNEKYNDVFEHINDYASEDSELLAAMKYVFRTGETKHIDDVEDLFEDVQIKEYTAFANHAKSENKTANDYSTMFKDEDGVYYDRETYYINFVGKMKSADVDAISNDWAGTLPSETADAEDDSFPTWAIVLISVGGGLAVAAAIVVPVVMYKKKQAKRQAEIESTRIRSRKNRLDTTDDKTIDVYADDTVEEAPVEETPVETSEENGEQAE